MAGLAELFTIICGTNVLLAYQSRCDFGYRKLSKPHMPNGVCQDLALSGRACQANWTPECLAEIKFDPAAAQVVWLVEGASMDYRPWITDRDEPIRPIFGDTLHIPHHFTGGHVGAGGNLALLASSRCQHLDMCASHIDHENRIGALGRRSNDFFSIWPPNPNRIAESNLFPKSSSPLDVNRW